MQRQQEGSHKYVRLTVNQHYLIDLTMLDLDAETATLVYYYHGARLSYKEIAQQLYNECSVIVTKGALTRICRLLMHGREQILASRLGKDDLTVYPETARMAILSILARGKDPKNERPEVSMAEETPSKDDNGPLLQADKTQEERPVTISSTSSDHPNSCPRCSGNMLFEKDIHGAYSTCFSCGYVFEPEIARLESIGKEKRKELSRRRNPSHGGQPL